MSGPFSSVSLNGQPTWTTIPTDTTSFATVGVGGVLQVPEVGYGQGGYGEDGYDTPSINIPASSQPNWTVETDR